MEKYLIVTDTTSAMDQEIAQKNGIELISLSVIVDGHEYKDQIDISTKQLYDYLRDGKIPSTSQPNTWQLDHDLVYLNHRQQSVLLDQ